MQFTSILKSIFVSTFISAAAVAAPGEPPLPATSASKPVSVSYENLTRCFTELQDASLSFKVDLDRLKDLIDEKFVTSNSVLEERRVSYLDANGQPKRVIMRLKKAGKKPVYVLTLQKVEDNGVFTDLKLSNAQKKAAPQQVIANLLLGGSIKADEYSYLDTKLNGYVNRYRRNFKSVEELELRDRYSKRTVACEIQKDLGIICTCSKK